MNENEIFDKVVSETNPHRRNQLIDELCLSDTQLRTRIEKLIKAHDQPDSFFEDPVEAQKNRESDEIALKNANSIKPGTHIGPYKLLEQIGEGGMGLVYMAEQVKPVQRRVALKVIKPGMDSRQVIARFEAERQALAMMDHPNIAKVLDAGTTTSGYPFFVMELVNGMPITDYCDQETMTMHDRLGLFVGVCRSVQHAHQKGVIHRDLKPSNILVAEYDGQPVPKVIDFGIAKATGMQLTEKTLFTAFGQVVGTIEYMSPEQSRRNQVDVDTRSDIYSLGVVLFKLLTGEMPFGQERFRQAAWDEMLKIIRDEEPPLPSVKIGSSQALRQIANNRNVDPKRLPLQVRGDLDWIVSKTLQKDRNRRYPSAGELADDIERHLNQLPIFAGPQGALDRVIRFVKRKRKAVAATMVGLLALSFLVGLAIQNNQQMKQANLRLQNANEQAELAIDRAMDSVIGNEAPWQAAAAHTERIKESLESGGVASDLRKSSKQLLDDFAFKRSERELAVQIEEFVIFGASNPDLASWEQMEIDMRDFFRKHGFDLDNVDPAAIGERIRNHPSQVMWADLLELWIGTRGHMQSLGGPRLNAAIMQPWANAIYAADDDPVRTTIRKFIYQPPPNRENLDKVLIGIDLKTLPPRTLAWLGACYSMVGDQEECDRVLQIGLDQYPQDVMLAHDYGYTLFHQKRYQESARMFHHCLALRPEVPGLWISLARTLEKLEEKDAAKRALEKAEQLKQAKKTKADKS